MWIIGEKVTLVTMTSGAKFKSSTIDVWTEGEKMYKGYRFTRAFRKYLQSQPTGKRVKFDREGCAICYCEDYMLSQKIIEQTCQKIIKEKKDKQVNEVKFSVKMDYLRTMIPILENLKEEGIKYYIPPIDEDTLQYNPFKKIYMDREDLEKYKEKVHSKFSNLRQGLITIQEADFNQADLILGDFPKIIGKSFKCK